MAVAAACVLVALLGLLLYSAERDTRQQTHFAGTGRITDGVHIEASVQQVNPAARELHLRVLVLPLGNLRENGNELISSSDIVVETSSLAQGQIKLPAGDRVSIQDIKVGLESTGGISDYPFDRYRTLIGFWAEAGGRQVPVSMELTDVDPFFTPRIERRGNEDSSATLEIRFSRSRSTLIFAWFMMAAMWATSLAVLGASWVIVDQKRGLVWPALGWMAATLFALVGFRNAAPGSPPIGSILDYTAFLWAEGVISVCVVAVAAYGIRVERAAAPHTS